MGERALDDPIDAVARWGAEGRRCGKRVTPSASRWEREVAPLVRRVQRLRGARSPSSTCIETGAAPPDRLPN